jgi:hypothetical protein
VVWEGWHREVSPYPDQEPFSVSAKNGDARQNQSSQHRDTARARMRVLVKQILRKYGYPTDLQDAAVQTVLQQAEALSAEWASA